VAPNAGLLKLAPNEGVEETPKPVELAPNAGVEDVPPNGAVLVPNAGVLPPNEEFVGAAPTPNVLPPNAGVGVVPNEVVLPNAGAAELPALPPNNPPPAAAPPPPKVDPKAGAAVEEPPKDGDRVAAPNAPVEVELKPVVDPKLLVFAPNAGYRQMQTKK